jgi:Lhr-like helicase
MKLVQAALFTLATLVALPATAQTSPAAKPAAKPTASDMEIFRQKVKADKKLLVSRNMELTEAEAKLFWPVYDGYQKELQQLNDRMGKLISTYADAYNKGPVSNETAKKLMDESLSIDEAENKMRRAYATRLEKAVPMMKAARYLQIESKIRALIKYELAANIPLVE